jgi:hypothetical protein
MMEISILLIESNNLNGLLQALIKKNLIATHCHKF